MISKTRNYFSFFGMMASSVDIKMHAFYSMIDNILHTIMPRISISEKSIVLKPVYTQTKNRIENN
jgi:hypothetical protein